MPRRLHFFGHVQNACFVCYSCASFLLAETDATLQVHVMTTLDADGCFWSQLDVDETEENLYAIQADQLQ